MAIPGVLSLKRQVARQEGRQDRLEAAVVDISQSVSQQTQQNVTVQPIFVTDVHQARVDAKRKSAALQQGRIPTDEEGDDESQAPPSPERAVLETQVIRLWELLQRWEANAGTYLTALDSGMNFEGPAMGCRTRSAR